MFLYLDSASQVQIPNLNHSNRKAAELMKTPSSSKSSGRDRRRSANNLNQNQHQQGTASQRTSFALSGMTMNSIDKSLQTNCKLFGAKN